MEMKNLLMFVSDKDKPGHKETAGALLLLFLAFLVLGFCIGVGVGEMLFKKRRLADIVGEPSSAAGASHQTTQPEEIAQQGPATQEPLFVPIDRPYSRASVEARRGR